MNLQGATMASGSLGRVIVVRLPMGCDLLRSLEELAEGHGIKSGVILSGAASLSRAVLRNLKVFPDSFPITDQVRVFTLKEEPMEVLSLSGNIAEKEGKVFVHGHITISSGEQDGLAYGGHLVEGCIVYSTAEIIIAELRGIQLLRLHNEQTKSHELSPVQTPCGGVS